jgi:hypothetical protein
MYDYNDNKTLLFYSLFSLVVLSTVGFLFWFFPTYNVWQKELSGKADLRQAEWSKQIAVQEAEARLQSAKLDAQSEIERAKGVKEANVIIAESLRGNEEYLRYLWIDKIAQANQQVIYVPTEAGLPILEAGKR